MTDDEKGLVESDAMPLCGDPTCRSQSCTQAAINEWLLREWNDAGAVWGLPPITMEQWKRTRRSVDGTGTTDHGE